MNKRLVKAFQDGDALPFYRFVNSKEYGRQDADTQWGAFLRSRLSDRIDRIQLALWEVRNLRMASNIRQVASQHPGGRVLVIVGAAHKPFLESYLGLMADVRIVDLLAR